MISVDEGCVIGDWPPGAPALTSSALCPVNSWNEWEPLEEVILAGWIGDASKSCECDLQ